MINCDNIPTVLSSWVIFWGEIGKRAKENRGEKVMLSRYPFEKKNKKEALNATTFFDTEYLQKEKKKRDEGR